ncbi:aspartic peptidase domain-containing protein [Mycena amicta]|nr:aspartic peptidase domain-containing protein [Mycena amicta]
MLLPLFFLLRCASTFVAAFPLSATSLEQQTISSKGNVLHLPITRRRTRLRVPRTNSAVGLGDFFDATYSVAVTIGGHEAPLLLDTGSSDLWIASTECSACDPSLPLFPNDQASFSAVSVDLQYGDSRTGTHAAGLVASASTFAFGGPKTSSLSSQVFVSVNDTDSTVLRTQSVGILPLGFPLTGVVWRKLLDATSSGSSLTAEMAFGAWASAGHPLTRMVLSGALDSPMSVVALQRDTVDIGGNEGMLSIGGLPPAVDNSSLAWVPIRTYASALPPPADSPNEIYPIPWELFIDDVFLDGVVLPRSNLTPPSIALSGLVDTGNSLLRGPADVVNEIYSRISPTYTPSSNPSSNNAPFPCSTPHTIAFSIGGRLFPVDSRDFITPLNNGVQNCRANVVLTDSPQVGKGLQFSWSLGDPFLKSVLSAYYFGNLTHPSVDPPRIGLLSTVPANASDLLQDALDEAKKENGGHDFATFDPAPTVVPQVTATGTAGVPAAPERNANAAPARTHVYWRSMWFAVLAGFLFI